MQFLFGMVAGGVLVYVLLIIRHNWHNSTVEEDPADWWKGRNSTVEEDPADWWKGHNSTVEEDDPDDWWKNGKKEIDEEFP